MKTPVKHSRTGYPFGMPMPGRSNSTTAYRYGFNGKENDNEVKGNANQQDYGMRIYDPRLGKFLSVDPLTKEYPELTPYQFASNTPIKFIDIDGLEAGELGDNSYRAALTLQNSQTLKYENDLRKKEGEQFKPIVKTLIEKPMDGAIRLSSTFTWALFSGIHQGATDMPLESFASEFTIKDGVRVLKDHPETDENKKELFKVTVSTVTGILTPVEGFADELTNEILNQAKDILIDVSLETIVPTATPSELKDNTKSGRANTQANNQQKKPSSRETQATNKKMLNKQSATTFTWSFGSQ